MSDISIDNIKLEIASDSSQAERSLDKLSASLMGLNRALVKIGNNAGGIRKIATSLSALNNLKLPDLTNTISQLEKLSNVDLKNLQGKKINLNIKLNGADEAERMKYAIKDVETTSAESAKIIAKRLQDAFRLDNSVMKGLRGDIKSMFDDIANGGYGGFDMNRILTTINDKGQITNSAIDKYFGGVGDSLTKEYIEFLDYVRAHPIKSSDITNDIGSGKKGTAGLKDTWYKEGLGAFQRKNGTALDTGYYNELLAMFPNVMSGFEQVDQSAIAFSADMTKVGENVSQQGIGMAEHLHDALVQAKTYLDSAIPESQAQSLKYSFMDDVFADINNQVQQKLNESMKESATKIPLDVQIDENRIEKQISDAIKRVAQKDFGAIKLKLGVDTADLKNELTTALGGANVDQLKGVTGELTQMLTAMRDMSGIDLKKNGISSFTSALARLSSESKNLDITIFGKIAEGMKELESSTETATGFGQFFRSISMFIKNVDNMDKAANTFPRLANVIQGFFASIASIPVSENTVLLAQALSEMAKNGRKAGTALQGLSDQSKDANKGMTSFSNVTGSVKEAFSSLLGIIRKFGSGAVSAIKSVIDKFRGLGDARHNVLQLNLSLKNLLGTLIGFRGITGVFNWAKDAVKAGGDLTEIDHIVDSVYGNMSDTVKMWADNMIESHGIASSAAKRYAGTLTAMAKASGISQEAAMQLGMQMTEAAGDISAFFNISTEESYQKLQSGLAGMARPLRSLGIDISQASLKQYALEQGITKNITAMTQGEKMMLRYKYILEVLNNETARGVGITGDYERTQYSYANSLRKLQAYLSAIKTQIGAGLAAALRPAIIALNQLMKHLLKAAQAFAAFMKTLFPFVNGASGMALGDAAAYTEDLAEGADDAASGLSDADDAAKKLKKDLSVLPFDELNQLNKDKESTSKGSGSGGGVGGVDFGLGEGLFDFGIKQTESGLSELETFINDWAERIKAAFKAKDWLLLGGTIADGLNLGIQKLYDTLDPDKARDKINPYIDAFTTTFNSLVYHLNWEKLGNTVGNGVNIVVNAVNRLIDPKTGINWNMLGSKLASGANGLVDSINFTNLGNMFGNKFMILWNVANGFVTDFDWVDLGEKLGEGVNGLNDGISWDTVGDTLATGLNGAFDSLKEFALTVDWKGLVENISSGINTFIRKFDWKDNGHTLQLFLENLVSALVDFLDKVDWEGLGSGIAQMIHEIEWLDLLGKAAEAIVKALGKLIKGLISEPEGTFITAIAAGFGLLKLGSVIETFTGGIATEIKGEKSVGIIKGAFEALFTKGLSGLTPALGPVALAVAGIAGGIYVAESYIKNDMPKISQDVKNLKEECDLALKGAGKIKSTFEEAMGAVQTETAKSEELAAPYLETLKGLASKTGELSNAERIRASEAIQGLIDIYPGLNGQITTQDTNLGKVVETAEKYITTTTNMAKAEVYYTKIKEATEQLVEIEEKRKEVGSKIEELNGTLNAQFEKQKPLVDAVSKAYGVEATDLNHLTKILQEHAGEKIWVNGQEQDAGYWAELTAKAYAEQGKTAEDAEAELAALGGELNSLNGAHADLTGTISAWDTELGKLDTTTQGTTKSLGTLADDAKKIPTDIKTGVTHTQGMPSEIIDKISKDMLLAMTRKSEGSDKSEFETESENIPQDAADGIENNAQVATDAAANLSNDMHESYENAFTQNGGVYLVSSKEIPQDIAKGIEEDQHLAVEAIQALCRNMKTEFDTKLNGEYGLGNVLKTSGGTLVSKLISGMDSKLDLLGNKVDEVYKKISKLTGKFESLNTDFYNAGQDLAQSIANGLASVHIEVPHVEFDGTYTRMYTGLDTWVEIPNYQVNWWAKGGLFTRPTLLSGLGEAGDEGVIPLSDKRAMSRIADAIVDNSGGGLGVSKQDIVDAVVYAMATNSQNQPPLNVYATLYTEDNEVLARAVERGNQSRDMRYNPTPAY